MSEYRLVEGFDGVQRVSDGAFIPNSDGNRDWLEYQRWLAQAGNAPEPVPPLPRPEPPPLEPVRVADPENDTDAVNRRYMNARLDELSHRIDDIESLARRART